MPCMGPDLIYARELGREVGAELFAQLIKKHKLSDITDKQDKDNDKYIRLPNSENRWNKAKQEFIRSVEEIFVEDACNGF